MLTVLDDGFNNGSPKLASSTCDSNDRHVGGDLLII
jgi:hypothetical protein